MRRRMRERCSVRTHACSWRSFAPRSRVPACRRRRVRTSPTASTRWTTRSRRRCSAAHDEGGRALSERRRGAAEEVVFRPVDNARLANLTGPVDANLRQIETALDVSISRRGERFTVTGPRDKAAQAAPALRRFYDVAHRDLTVEDIQLGLVEIAHPRKKGDEAVPALVIPRRPELAARTPRQAQYLQNMRAFDITFCVGPAGTGKTFLALAAAIHALSRGPGQ